jgi:TolA-binding protein
MTDSNYGYTEATVKRKRKNQIISVLIIIAVVMAGVGIWGIQEIQKSRNAERIKSALSTQVEAPNFGVEDSLSAPPPVETLLDTPEVVIEDIPPEITTPTPKAPVAAIEPVKPKPIPPPAPVVVQPKPIAPKPAPVVKSAPTPSPISTIKPDANAKAETKQQPKVESTPEPVKAFAPEDLPAPKEVTPSPETQLAMKEPDPPMPVPSVSEGNQASESFRLGMQAYQQQDFVNAIRNFAGISKPTTRKRGDRGRDEYVQGNFLRGVSLLKVGHMSEAVTAFLNVLEYEKFYPMANMNLGICYVELKQYAKAHHSFEADIRDQNRIDPAMYDDVMQRTRYFWALAWTRLFKAAEDPDRANYYKQQAVLRWKDYQVWFAKQDKYKSQNQQAENYLRTLTSL